MERKNFDDFVSKCRKLEVVGGTRKGRGKKRWIECVATDMKKIRLKKKDVQNRSLWSSLIN